MITPHRLKKVDDFYSRFFEGAILKDLDKMINQDGLNFVIVSTILGAINLLGSLYLGKRSNHSIKEFIDNFFQEEYKPHAEILSDHFRNNLIHTAYVPRGMGVSRGREDIHLRAKQTPEGTSYIIDSDQLYKDFELALKRYFEEVKQNEELLEKFESRVDKIERYLPEQLKTRFVEVPVPTPSISNATYYPFPIYFEIEKEEVE